MRKARVTVTDPIELHCARCHDMYDEANNTPTACKMLHSEDPDHDGSYLAGYTFSCGHCPATETHKDYDGFEGWSRPEFIGSHTCDRVQAEEDLKRARVYDEWVEERFDECDHCQAAAEAAESEHSDYGTKAKPKKGRARANKPKVSAFYILDRSASCC